MNKPMYIIGAILIAGFAVLGVLEMLKAQTPYVETVAQVRAAGEQPVQFIGAVVHNKTSYDDRADELAFTLQDKTGKTLDVRYKGVKPTNFEHADKAVARGVYRDGKLVADQVLVKCPSKYQNK